jgi:hypothetical protein
MICATRTRAAGAALLLVPAVVSCGADPAPPSAPPSAPPPTRIEAIPLVYPVRYLVPDASWIERTPDGLDRVVANGRRMEVRGVETVRLGPAEPEVYGGAVAPPWAGAGPSRYVFWSGRDLYGTESFTGELHKIATLPVEPQRAFDWLDGLGLILSGGVVTVPAAGGAPAPLKVAVVATAIAADARRAVAVSALGHTFLTIDGGASYRDASAELGQASSLEVRGDDLAVLLHNGRERFISAAGLITETRAESGTRRGKPAASSVDLWPHGAAIGALEAAVRNGLPLPDGGAVIAGRGFVGRLDLTSLRTTSVASLEGMAPDADCIAFRAADAPLLTCAGPDRASVIDISGVPRLERTFDLTGAPELDRFVGFDGEALGYLGPCDGGPKEAPALDEAHNALPSRSAVFCVRKGREEWAEHRLDPADASDVVAWIPRPSGGAVALVARPGTFLPEAQRITVRGALRVVRVARNEPPLAFPPYGYRGSMTLNRSLHVRADNVLEGWLPASSGAQSAMAVTIDEAGHPRAFASPPRGNQILTAGLFAITQTDEGRLFETIDGGRRWTEIDKPPGAAATFPSHCSPVGCKMGPFVRIGWSGPFGEAKPVTPAPAQSHTAREPAQLQTPPPKAPALVRLVCSFNGPAEGKRAADSSGFGFTASSQPRSAMPIRIGTLGVATFPWSGAQPSSSGDVELDWVSPLDLTGTIRRSTLALSRIGMTAGSHRAYEVKLGYIVDAHGGLDVVPVGSPDACLSSLLERAGISRSVGGCAEDPSVGVDLGSKVLVLHPTHDAIVTSAANAVPRPKTRASARVGDPRATSRSSGARPVEDEGTALSAVPVALHELARTATGPGTRGFTLGAGVRDGAPVVVTLDVHGAAILALVAPERGTLGPEEPLRPLTAVALGSDASCAAARTGEARVALPFDTEIGLDRASLRGVFATGSSGIAVLRWSKERACLDAVEIAVRDERFDADLNSYPNDVPGTVRKLVARFSGAGMRQAGSATLLLISNGMEVRQPITCKGIVVGHAD